MSWINNQQLSKDHFREPVEDVEKKGTSLLEQRWLVKEELAHLASEKKTTTTEKRDSRARRLGRHLHYKSFTVETENDLQQSLLEQNKLFSYNMSVFDCRAERSGTEKYNFEFALLQCRCLEVETQYDNLRAQYQHLKAQLLKFTEDNTNEMTLGAKVLTYLGSENVNMDVADNDDLKAQMKVSMESNLLDQQHMALIDQVSQLQQHKNNMESELADLRSQAKVNKENEDSLMKLNLLLKNEVAQLKSSLKTDADDSNYNVLPENRSHPDERMESLSDELARRQSRGSTMEKENGDLRAQLNILQENKKQQDDKMKHLKDQVALLQSHNIEMETQCSNLKAQIQFHREDEEAQTDHNNVRKNGLVELQSKMETGITADEKHRLEDEEHDQRSETKERRKDELRTQVKALHERNNQLHDEVKSLTEKLSLLQTQKAKTETHNCDLRAKVKALQENKNQLDDEMKSLSDQIAVLQSQKTKVETQNGDLRAQVKALQENEDILIKQNEFLNDEVSQLERFNVRTDKQNENLRTRVKALRENENILSEKTENLMADLSHFENQRDKDQSEIYGLRTELQTLRCQLQDQDELLRRIDHAESLMEKEWAENERLKSKLSELEEEGNFVKKQNDVVRVELENHKSLQDQQSEQIAQLRCKLKDQKVQLEEAQFLLYSKDDELAKQNRRIAYLNEVTEELNSLLSSFKQRIHELQTQLELRQMDEILTASSSCGSLMETANDEEFASEDERESSNVDNPHQRNNNQKTLLMRSSSLHDSPSLKMETENEELRTQVKELQENKVRLVEENTQLSDKLESLTSNADTKNGHLMAQVEDHRENEKKLIQQNQVFGEKLTELERRSLKTETENEELRTQVKELQENKVRLVEENTKLNDKLAHLESLTSNADTKNGHLMAQVEDHRENEKKLIQQNQVFGEKLTELERRSLKTETENGDLRVQVEDLKENEKLTKQRTETLVADLSRCESQRDKYKTESNRLRLEVQTLRSQLQDESDLRRRIDHAESQMEKKWAENDKLSDRLRDLEKKDESLKKQHDGVRAELEEQKSIRDQQQQQIAKLMAALNDNKHQVKKAGFLLYNKDDELAQQKREIDHQNGIIQDLNTTIRNLKLNLGHRQDQLEPNQTANKRPRPDTSRLDATVESVMKSDRFRPPNPSTLFRSNFKGFIKSSVKVLSAVMVFVMVLILFNMDNFSLKPGQTGNIWKMTFNDVKTRKSILTERKRFLDDELARLESQSVKLETEKKDLRVQMKDIQEKNMTTTELKTSRNEEITRPYSLTVKMDAEDADLAEELNDQKNTIEENELVDHKRTRLQMWRMNMEAENEELRAQVKVLEDNKAMSSQQNMLLAEKLSHLESWSVKMETHLRMQIKYLQEKEDTLTKQNECLINEVAQLERWAATTEKENENLRARVKVLKENENLMNEVTEAIAADLAHAESLRGEDQTEMYRLRTKLQTLRCQLQDQEELLRRLGHAGSLMEKAWAENEKLNNKLSEHADEDPFVKKQNQTREELREHRPVKDLKHLERIAQLEAAVKERQTLLSGKDEMLEKQRKEIVQQHEVIDKLNSLLTPLKQTIRDLQTRLELQQMDEILTPSSSCGSFNETVSEEPSQEKNQSSQIKELRQNGNASMRGSPSLNPVRDLQENEVRLAFNDKVHPESQSANVNTNLMDQVEDLRKNEDRLTEQKQLFSEKLPQLESLSGNTEPKVQVEDPIKNGFLQRGKPSGVAVADSSGTGSQGDKDNIQMEQEEHQENKSRIVKQNNQFHETWCVSKVHVEDPRENEYILSENTEEPVTLDLSNSESQWDNDHLWNHLKDLQENQTSFTKQNMHLHGKAETNNGDPEENENVLSEKTDTVTDWSNLDSQWDKDDTEVYHLKTDAQVFWCLLQDQGDLKTTTDQAESRLEKEWTQNEKLRNRPCDLYDKQHVLRRYDSVVEDQEDHNNVGDQQSKTVTHLKTTLADPKLRVEEPGRLILKSQSKDRQHGDKDGRNPLFASFREAFFNCKRQLKRMEEILTANNLETQPKGQQDPGLLHSAPSEGCSNLL
uniref:putative leucine-rich repeat-containing protein DDB_G0290503 n=1 Tax=Doryrhamphus excisus TaxID=161450 RepID=UPI0025AE8B4C|nr:putative leucine-rich repeat-containing protein DDB_G0290503 [Doryrhamphus excisus]